MKFEITFIHLWFSPAITENVKNMAQNKWSAYVFQREFRCSETLTPPAPTAAKNRMSLTTKFPLYLTFDNYVRLISTSLQNYAWHRS